MEQLQSKKKRKKKKKKRKEKRTGCVAAFGTEFVWKEIKILRNEIVLVFGFRNMLTSFQE